MKFGIIKEGKIPPDKRVPLTPAQCRSLKNQFPGLEIVVQKSDVRAIPDADYLAAGLPVVDSLADCDVIFGVKEVPIEELLPGKTYFFFSHTIKEQPYNRKLLQTVIERNIKLVDYETLTDRHGIRLIGFGRYAGIAGCYNGLYAYGIKSGDFELKRAYKCHDRKEMEKELDKVVLPDQFRIVMTGLGRVGKGASEILDLLKIKKVNPDEFLSTSYDEPVYTQLSVEDYNARIDGRDFVTQEFYLDPSGFHSTFGPYLKTADMYIACHFWDARAPIIVGREDLLAPGRRTSIIADISCDIDGPIASTIRPSTIPEPLYGYDPLTGTETDFMDKNAVGVMAVDNLPCELPRDASADFGSELVENIIPCLLGEDPDKVIERGTIAENGHLTEKFSYLKGYLRG